MMGGMDEHPGHDVGGLEGLGPIDTHDEHEGFHHEWEARVFAINRVLLRDGHYTLDEFRYALERIDPQTRHEATYYERWLMAIEMLLAEKGTLDAVPGG